MENVPTRVQIPGTDRVVKVSGIKPYTLERLTKLWIERDVERPTDSASTLRSMCKEPYFAIKEAVILVLNGYWALRFIYPFKWRIWAYLRGYTESQMTVIIAEGKKKLQLMAHWNNMAFSVDMRTDWMKMTEREAEQYRAELVSVERQHSSRNSPNTASGDGGSDRMGIGAD